MRFPEQDISDQPSIASQSQDTPSAEPGRAASKRPHPSLPLSAEQLLMLVEESSFEIPYVTQEDIKDRSKADVFTKLFAIGQSAWLTLQCIARAAQGLRESNHRRSFGRLLTTRAAITELELATMGFVGCALVMYLLWWDKPFDVQHSLYINCPHKDRDRVIRRLCAIFQERYTSKFLSPNWDDFLRERRLRNWAYMNDLGLGKNQGQCIDN